MKNFLTCPGLDLDLSMISTRIKTHLPFRNYSKSSEMPQSHIWVIYFIFYACRSKLLKMTVGMDSSNGGGKFPDYQSQLKFFKVIYFGESGQYIVDK